MFPGVYNPVQSTVVAFPLLVVLRGGLESVVSTSFGSVINAVFDRILCTSRKYVGRSINNIASKFRRGETGLSRKCVELVGQPPRSIRVTTRERPRRSRAVKVRSKDQSHAIDQRRRRSGFIYSPRRVDNGVAPT